MANYFLGTEFIESFYTNTSGRRRHFIDLISIGIVSDSGKTFYAESKDFSEQDANPWVKENVLTKLGPVEDRKSNVQIAKDLLVFFDCKLMGDKEDGNVQGWIAPDIKNFYAYFADYDWVVFCSLFGRMIDLPKGFPFYCMDLKQMMVERWLSKDWKAEVCPDPEGEHNALADAKWNYELYQQIIAHAGDPGF